MSFMSRNTILFFTLAQAKASLEEKNSTLLENMARLKEEARDSEVRRAGLEADLRRLQEEHSDLVRRAASAEASLQVASKVGKLS